MSKLPRRDLTEARLLRGQYSEDIKALLKDRETAEKLAKLAASANARGAAPLPPGAGGGAPKPAAAAPSAPAKVDKYRAIADYEGEVTFQKGATVFIVGEVDSSGMVQAVAGGKAGKAPADKLKLITPELLEEERVQREKELEELRKQEEEELRKEMENMKLEHAKQSDGGASEGGASAPTKSAEQLEYEKKLDEEFDKERQRLLEEENKLKEEAARIEAMLRELDADD